MLAGAVVLNLATFAPPWMAALPGLGFRDAMAMTQASTALSIISPAGAAVGMAASYSMLRSWKFQAGAVGLAVAIAGIWNQLLNLAFPVVALALLTAEGQNNPGLRTAALIGVAALIVAITAFALVLSRRNGPRASAIGRPGSPTAGCDSCAGARLRWGGASFSRFRSEALGLLRRRWHVITVATLAGHLTVFVLLLTCLRVTGVTESEVTVVEAFAAWALVRILGALPLHARRCRFRRGRSDRRARGIRCAQRRGGRGDAALPGAHGAPDSRARTAVRSHLAHAPPGGHDRFSE